MEFRDLVFSELSLVGGVVSFKMTFPNGEIPMSDYELADLVRAVGDGKKRRASLYIFEVTEQSPAFVEPVPPLSITEPPVAKPEEGGQPCV